MKEEHITQISKQIEYAINNTQCVVIHYQPISNNNTNKIDKYEVLMRLNIDGKMLYPNQFLSVAKEINRYKELSKIVIEKAFIYFSDKNSNFSINLSSIDIEDDEFEKFFFDKINQYKISHKLTVEIVESEEINRNKKFYNFIYKLKLLNCKIAIDDFGIGYTNLEFILDISDHIDYIKFDGSLIKKIVENDKIQLFLGNLKYLCDNIKVDTVAEFVENKEILRYIKSLGINYSQGYHIGMPTSEIDS